MGLIRWLLLLPVLLVLVLFGLSNKAPVAVKLWPFDLEWIAPLGIVGLSIAGGAFLFGAIVAWLAGAGARRRARQMSMAAKVLEAELMDFRGRAARDLGPVPPAPVPALRLQQPAA